MTVSGVEAARMLRDAVHRSVLFVCCILIGADTMRLL